MSLSELFAGGGGILVVLMTLVQVSKIEINPWSWIAKHLGRAINGEVLEKIDVLDTRVDKLESDIKKAGAISEQRDIEPQDAHTKEHFDQILMDITHYENYCKAYPDFENNVTDLTIAHIKSVYQKCWQNHSFL